MAAMNAVVQISFFLLVIGATSTDPDGYFSLLQARAKHTSRAIHDTSVEAPPTLLSLSNLIQNNLVGQGQRFGVGSGLVWSRFGLGLGSVWRRSGVGSGLVWGRFGVGLSSVWGRFGLGSGGSRVGSGSVRDRFGVGLGSPVVLRLAFALDSAIR